METSKIIPVMKRASVTGNYFLFEALSNMEKTTRPDKITESIRLAGRYGNTEMANLLIDILWPLIIDSAEPAVPIIWDQAEQQSYSLDFSGSPSSRAALDVLLLSYVRCLKNIIEAIVIINNQAVLEKAAYELMCASHLLSDPEQARSCFRDFHGYMAGHHPGASIRRAASILRQSFNDVPVLNYNTGEKNLLAYMVELKERLEREDVREHVEVLMDMLVAISIGLCHRMNPNRLFDIFLPKVEVES